MWPTLAPSFCNGSRQSPINIVSSLAQSDHSLSPVIFTNFGSRSALTHMENTGKTVKVSLASGVSVSGGGLTETYHCLQFHLHWGDGLYLPGSEHTLDGRRFPMELHIVSIKASHKGNIASALADPTGLAALGFFIDGMFPSQPNKPDAWHSLTSYLSSIKTTGSSVAMSPGISLDDLLVGVDPSKYFRYLGSLTTPDCNEAVVWTVFKDPVRICPSLINLFSSTVYQTDSATTFISKNYREIQPKQPVSTQAPQSHSKTYIKG